MTAFPQTVADATRTRGRIGADLQLLLDLSPGLAGLGLFVELVASEDGDGIAYTDGQRVVMEPRYWTHPTPERLGIFAHELLHVGLAHPLRAKRLRALEGRRFDAHLWNVACDAVINYALGKHPSPSAVRLPQNCVSIEQPRRRRR